MCIYIYIYIYIRPRGSSLSPWAAAPPPAAADFASLCCDCC